MGSTRRVNATAALLGVLAGAAPVAAHAHGADSIAAAPSPGEAAHEAGLQAYERGDFREAMAQFQRAYELDRHASDLYGWAQAAREAGDCTTALELYERFIALGIEGEARAAAEQNAARCRTQLEAEGKAPTSDSGGNTVPEPEETAPTEEDGPSPTSPEQPSPPEDRSGRRDVLGLSLVSVGSAATLAGVAMLGVAETQRMSQQQTEGYARFDTLDRRIDRLHLAGSITVGVGVGLAVAGVVRLVVRRSRHDRAATTRLRRWSSRRPVVIIGSVPIGGRSN